MTLEFTIDPELTDELRAQVVACWTDVTNAGGAVGFVPPVTMDDVLPVAERALAGVAAGRDRLVIGRAAESTVLEDGTAEIEDGTAEIEDGAVDVERGIDVEGTVDVEGGVDAVGAAAESGIADGDASRMTSVGGRLAALAFITDERSLVAEHLRVVKRVMVHPDFQGRRYGIALMAEVERTARAMGLKLLTLDCRGGTGSDKFYEKCGYVEYGRLPAGLRIGEDEYRDRILMTLSLSG